jgi:endonuclease I
MKHLCGLIALWVLSLTALAQTSLPTSWNFSTPPVSSPPPGWTFGIGLNGTGGLTYTGSGFSVGGDNISARFDATGEFVTISFAEKPGPLSYYIKGTGIATSFTGIFSIQESVDGAAWTTLREFNTTITPPNPVPGGSMSANKFTDTPSAAARFVRFFYTSKEQGTNVALDSVLLRTAPPAPTASLVVKVGAATVINSGSYTVGSQSQVDFQLNNPGTQQALAIDSVRISGPASDDYSTGIVPASVAAGSSAILPVNFAASSNGSRLANLRIYSNAAGQSPYVIRLYGIGGNLATEPPASPAAILTGDVSSFGFRVGVSAPSSPAEKYLLVQSYGAPFNAQPQDGIAYKTGDRIGNGMVVYNGDSLPGNFRPRYILASSTYYLSAYSFNGPAGFENYRTFNPATATVETSGKQPGNYYNGIDPSLPTFVSDLTARIYPRDTIFYSAYAPRLVSSWLERDTTVGRKVVNCVYTGLAYIYEGSFNWWTGQGGNPATLTREHTYAQSWMPSNTGTGWPTDPNGKEYPEYNDLHHLFPAHQTNANSRRSNNPFGVVVNATYTSPTGRGKSGTNAGGQTVYEPQDSHKGDAARALMYMAACFHKATPQQYDWRFPTNQSPAVILQWHQQDPPSNLEIARHELIYKLQNNRNPFIDNPEWAFNINFASMTYLPTAIEKADFRNRIATWPNPASGWVNVDATLIFEPSLRYDWMSADGRVAGTGTLEAPMGRITTPAEKGVYFLRLHTSRGTVVTRLLKD